jgi:hypothetical protein
LASLFASLPAARSQVLAAGRHSGLFASPEQSVAHAHLEGVELQSECRQRQPEIIQFFGPRVIAVIHGTIHGSKCHVRSGVANIN